VKDLVNDFKRQYSNCMEDDSIEIAIMPFVTFSSCDTSGTNMDKAAHFDTKSLSPPSKGLKPKIKNHRVVLMTDVHISLVAKFAFICFLKSLCSFLPFVTFCHSGHVILTVT